MRDTAHQLATITILDSDGAPVVVGSAWREQPALLVFIRHFG